MALQGVLSWLSIYFVREMNLQLSLAATLISVLALIPTKKREANKTPKLLAMPESSVPILQINAEKLIPFLGEYFSPRNEMGKTNTRNKLTIYNKDNGSEYKNLSKEGFMMKQSTQEQDQPLIQVQNQSGIRYYTAECQSDFKKSGNRNGCGFIFPHRGWCHTHPNWHCFFTVWPVCQKSKG